MFSLFSHVYFILQGWKTLVYFAASSTAPTFFTKLRRKAKAVHFQLRQRGLPCSCASKMKKRANQADSVRETHLLPRRHPRLVANKNCYRRESCTVCRGTTPKNWPPSFGVDMEYLLGRTTRVRCVVMASFFFFVPLFLASVYS